MADLGEEVREKRRLAVPLQTTGTGWDVGWAAVYLASEESRWVTGIELPIDAGRCGFGSGHDEIRAERSLL